MWSIPVLDTRNIPKHLFDEREAYKQEIQTWEKVTSYLFSSYSADYRLIAKSEKEKEDWIIITILKIHVAINNILLARAFFPPETKYDILVPEFRTISDLSTIVRPHLILLSSSSLKLYKSTPFHFEIGIIPGLAIVGNLCRDSLIRYKAISLLLDIEEYKEGV
jgi:hypothetical protein